MTGLETLAYQVTRGALAAVLEHIPQLRAAMQSTATDVPQIPEAERTAHEAAEQAAERAGVVPPDSVGG
jgi:hypothetical protein